MVAVMDVSFRKLRCATANAIANATANTTVCLRVLTFDPRLQSDSTGKLGFHEFKYLWGNIKRWQVGVATSPW